MRNAAIGVCCLLLSSIALQGGAPDQQSNAQPAGRPNIVLMFPDNLGWGEVGVYGGVRGAPTPRLDKLAAEGLRLNNFNVEFSCTVSRAALMTGRYAIRTGATQGNGITLWEVTIAEALKSAGYATGLFGKWHLGGDAPEGKREPSHQGFDEYYGIPRTSNEAQTTIANGSQTPGTSFIWEGRAGEPSRHVGPFDMQSRPLVDREAAKRGIAFMERNVKARTPFFMYYPITQIHFPTIAHPDFAGKSGAGDIGDAMMDTDYNVGLVLDAIDKLGIARKHDRVLVFGQRRRGATAVARIAGTVGRLLQHGHGRRRARAVPRALARKNSGRARVQRNGPRDRSVPDAGRRGRRRYRAEGSRDRRRQPTGVLRRQAAEVQPRHGHLLYRLEYEPAARGEVARLEVLLRVPIRARRRRNDGPGDAAVQSAIGPARRN
jgi:hypothetical protein